MNGCIISNSGSITVVYNNKSYMVNKDHVNYTKIKDKLKKKDYKDIDKLIDASDAVNKAGKGHVTVMNGVYLLNSR